MDECIDFLEDATVFSSLKANWEHWQMPVAKKDEDKNIFTIHSGTYWFDRMLFELINASATFQHAPVIIHNKYTLEYFLVYLDHRIIFSKTNDQNLKDIEDILATLYAPGALLKQKKCQWLTTKVEYLGYTITLHRLSITKTQTKGLKNLKHLRTLTELSSFIGKCSV